MGRALTIRVTVLLAALAGASTLPPTAAGQVSGRAIQQVPDVPVDLTAQGARLHRGAVLSTGTPEEGIARLLSHRAGDLELIRDTRLEGSRHLLFRQRFRGIPVWNRLVRASLDSQERATIVHDGSWRVDPEMEMPLLPSIPGSRVAGLAQTAAGGPGAIHGPPELVILPLDTPRLAWRVVIWPIDRVAELEVMIDALDGTALSIWDATTHTKGPASPAPTAALDSADPARAEAASRIDGEGRIFDPDPLATSGSDYVAPFVDAGDADAPELTAQLKSGTLRDVTQGTDGLYRLEGPYVRIVGENSGGLEVYVPPAEASPRFEYTRGQSGFEAVNAYYHMDTNQRYIQSLGFADLQSQAPIRVNPQGSSADDSGWLASQRYLFLGTGGVDDGEDAAVVLHEYAHALLEAGAPGLRSTLEGQALHEGWADYWAMSYQRALIDAGLVARSDWEEVFRWDSGLGQIWPGRRLDFSGRYPEATCSDNGVVAGCSVHNDGRLWGTVMMRVYTDLGREVTDRLNLLSHRYLAPGVTFPAAAEAVIQADIDHYGGAHVETLIGHLADAGLVDPSTFGPIINHAPLASVEDLGGTRPVTAEARGIASGVAQMMIHWRHGSDAFQALSLAAGPNNTFSGEIPLPDASGEVSYFLQAVDTEGRESLLPADAPGGVFSFTVGPDTTPPSIVHTPLSTVSLAQWPPTVAASVADELGVASVDLEYELTRPGEPTTSGVQPLIEAGGMWTATLEVPLSEVVIGTTVSYVIRARDAAAASNQTALGPFSFEVSGMGVLRAFDPDALQSEVTLTGSFAVGRPSAGTLTSPSGANVWATNPSGPYPPTTGRASLELPAVNLSGANEPRLVFWHWYDMEHDGRAAPGITGADHLWDGGNVKISTDGVVWTVVQPQGGYTGSIIGGPDNPMSGEEAFGGFSFGWRREVVPLPAQAGVRVRFDFGTDATNDQVSLAFSGWVIDDISITTEVPVGAQPPRLTSGPDPVLSAAAGEPLPEIRIVVQDDVGVSDAWLEYTYHARTGVVEGVTRLAQSPSSLAVFSGRMLLASSSQPGDQVDYHIRLRDVDDNEVVVPSSSSSPYVLNIRLSEAISLLQSAAPSGTWSRRGQAWQATGSAMGGLVLGPVTLAKNDVGASLTLEHDYRFSVASGGMIEVSSDDGAIWQSVEPDGGYPGSVGDVDAYTGASQRTDVIDLLQFAGHAILLRFVPEGEPGGSDRWRVSAATLRQESEADAFDLPEDTVLHANFPDPFSTSTYISYSLPESASVTLTVHDMLGRRVATLDRGMRDAGSHSMTLSADNLASGVYLLRLDTGATVKFEMLTVAR